MRMTIKFLLFCKKHNIDQHHNGNFISIFNVNSKFLILYVSVHVMIQLIIFTRIIFSITDRVRLQKCDTLLLL